MPISNVGGEVGEPLVCAMHVATTYQTAIAVGDTCVVSTSGNWAINSAATSTDIRTVGKVLTLAGDAKTAVVKWFGYNKAFVCADSGTCTLGHSILSAANGYVQTSNNATRVIDCICVATDYPASNYIGWLEN